MIFTNCNIDELYISLNSLLSNNEFEIDLFKPGTFIRLRIDCNKLGFNIESQDNKITVLNNLANNEHWIYNIDENEFRSKLIDQLISLHPNPEYKIRSKFLEFISEYKTDVHIFFNFDRINNKCIISYVGIGDSDDLELKFNEGLEYLLQALKLNIWNLNKEIL